MGSRHARDRHGSCWTIPNCHSISHSIHGLRLGSECFLARKFENGEVSFQFQKVEDLPPKDLRKLVDIGKKEIGDGIVIVFASKDDKVGLAVGVTEKLTEKYDAVKFAKLGSEIIEGKGGGGRKDFAQAGGQNSNKIDEAFEKLKALI